MLTTQEWCELIKIKDSLKSEKIQNKYKVLKSRFESKIGKPCPPKSTLNRKVFLDFYIKFFINWNFFKINYFKKHGSLENRNKNAVHKRPVRSPENINKIKEIFDSGIGKNPLQISNIIYCYINKNELY